MLVLDVGKNSLYLASPDPVWGEWRMLGRLLHTSSLRGVRPQSLAQAADTSLINHLAWLLDSACSQGSYPNKYLCYLLVVSIRISQTHRIVITNS